MLTTVKENRIISLKRIMINTQDSFGKTQEFNNWSSANRALRLYNAKSWEHEGERVYYVIEWEGNRQIESSFILPSIDNLPKDFLEGIVQDYLNERALIPASSLSSAEIDKLVRSISYLSEYITSINKQKKNLYYELLERGEGLDRAKYARDIQRLNTALTNLNTSSPLLAKVIDNAKNFYALISSLKDRTHFFKEYIFHEGNRDISKGLSSALSGDEEITHFALDNLQVLIKKVCDEITVTDERFTEHGMTIYQLYPLDRHELPQRDTPFNDFLGKDMRDRILHVKTASIADSTQPEPSIFYSCYSQALEEVLQLPPEKRSHKRVSCLVFNRLRLYNIAKSRRAVLIDLYDPYAVGVTGYGKLISAEYKTIASPAV